MTLIRGHPVKRYGRSKVKGKVIKPSTIVITVRIQLLGDGPLSQWTV